MWNKRLDAFRAKPLEHTVQGESLKFYPISVNTAVKAKNLVEHLAQAVNTMTGGSEGDNPAIRRTINGENGGTEDIIEAVPVELAKLRTEQRQQAISNLVKAITDDGNLRALGEILKESLKDEFEGESDLPASEVVSTLPLPVLTDMLMGIFLANKEMFGPLSRKAEELMKKLRKTATEHGQAGKEATAGTAS